MLSVRHCWNTEDISVNHFYASNLTWVTATDQLKRHKMDDFLLKAAELTLGSSDDGFDKILFETSCQFDCVSPHTAKRPKMDIKESDRFLQYRGVGSNLKVIRPWVSGP